MTRSHLLSSLDACLINLAPPSHPLLLSRSSLVHHQYLPPLLFGGATLSYLCDCHYTSLSLFSVSLFGSDLPDVHCHLLTSLDAPLRNSPHRFLLLFCFLPPPDPISERRCRPPTVAAILILGLFYLILGLFCQVIDPRPLPQSCVLSLQALSH